LASRDGTKQRPVLVGKGHVSYRDPAWSASGRLAVTQDYEPDEGMGSAGVIVIRPGRAPLDVPGGTSPFDGAPTWAPDNKQIALIGYNYGSPRGGFLYVNVPRTTGGSQPIDGDAQEDDLDDQPAWSPDGHRIAFARYLGGRFGLFSIAPDGSNRRQLTQRTAHNPSWSPDSRRIVFDDGHHIKVINVDGSGLKTLFTARPGDHASNPAWSPDGRLIAFDYGGSKGDQIWTMSPNGSHPHMVIRNARDPAWKRG
jgi:TolB protein